MSSFMKGRSGVGGEDMSLSTKDGSDVGGEGMSLSMKGSSGVGGEGMSLSMKGKSGEGMSSSMKERSGEDMSSLVNGKSAVGGVCVSSSTREWPHGSEDALVSCNVKSLYSLSCLSRRRWLLERLGRWSEQKVCYVTHSRTGHKCQSTREFFLPNVDHNLGQSESLGLVDSDCPG